LLLEKKKGDGTEGGGKEGLMTSQLLDSGQTLKLKWKLSCSNVPEAMEATNEYLSPRLVIIDHSSYTTFSDSFCLLAATAAAAAAAVVVAPRPATPSY
jgi:hypothetical protein